MHTSFMFLCSTRCVADIKCIWNPITYVIWPVRKFLKLYSFLWTGSPLCSPGQAINPRKASVLRTFSCLTLWVVYRHKLSGHVCVGGVGCTIKCPYRTFPRLCSEASSSNNYCIVAQDPFLNPGTHSVLELGLRLFHTFLLNPLKWIHI